MIHWLFTNIGTIAVSVILLFTVVLIVRKLLRDRRKGTFLCGGSCGNCAAGCSCRHSK